MLRKQWSADSLHLDFSLLAPGFRSSVLGFPALSGLPKGALASAFGKGRNGSRQVSGVEQVWYGMNHPGIESSPVELPQTLLG